MRIQSSNVALSGAHSYFEQQTREESFQFWVGSRRPAAGAEDERRLNVTPPPAPERGRRDLPTAPPATAKTKQAETEAEDQLDPLDRMMKALVEKLFGVKIKIAFVPKTDGQPPELSTGGDCPKPPEEADPAVVQRQGWGLDYQLRETRTESEQTDFSAKGVVQTADGQRIKFDLSLTMQREFTEEYQFRLQAGDALIDPLVVNFNGTAAQLTDQRYAFDLNADRQNENIPFVKAGSAFLALDKNGDGKINNGRELFGPTTGNGFSELAQYDADGNSWIDENDPVYDRLRLWSLDDAGKTKLTSLAEKNVGAIYLGNTSTPFTLKTDAQETQGQIASTGIYLNEQGGAGLVQQVNLVA
jgi:hypothetical protein